MNRPRSIGVAFDGVGLRGPTAARWGGEFLVADLAGIPPGLRHLPRRSPMPGGDIAARQPWRMALSHLDAAYEGATCPPAWRWRGRSGQPLGDQVGFGAEERA